MKELITSLEQILDGIEGLDWQFISRDQELSEEFIHQHADLVAWKCVSKCQKLSEEIINQYTELVDWDRISQYQKLSEELIH